MSITHELAIALLAATMFATQAHATEFYYTHRYDNAHLAQHPEQLVTSLLLYINDKVPSNDPAYPAPWFTWKLVATRRGEKHLLVQTANLISKTGSIYHASVDCDGAGFDFNLIPGGLHMSIKYSLRMAIVPDPCGEGREAITQSTTIGGGDDREFLLQQVPVQGCTTVTGRIDWDSIPAE
jgi:hypothetical protein